MNQMNIFVQNQGNLGSSESVHAETPYFQPQKNRSDAPQFEKTYHEKLNQIKTPPPEKKQEAAVNYSEEEVINDNTTVLSESETEKLIEFLQSLMDAISGQKNPEGTEPAEDLLKHSDFLFQNLKPDQPQLSPEKWVQGLGLSDEQQQMLQKSLNGLSDEARIFLENQLASLIPDAQVLKGELTSENVSEKLEHILKWLKDLKSLMNEKGHSENHSLLAKNALQTPELFAQTPTVGENAFSMHGESQEKSAGLMQWLQQQAENGTENNVRQNGTEFSGIINQLSEQARPEFAFGTTLTNLDAVKVMDTPVVPTPTMDFEKWNEIAEKVIRQVSTGMVSSVKNGIQRLHIQLVPEHLGKVEIRMSIKSETLSGKLVVENEMVRQVVESQLPQLKEAIEQHTKIDSLEVSVDERTSQHGGLGAGHDGSEHAEWGTEGYTQNEASTLPEDGQYGEDTGRRLGYNTMEMVA